MPMTDQQRERLAELRAADVGREGEAQEAADAQELEARGLRVLLEGRGQKVGVDFEIIDNPLGGVYALRKPDTKAIRNWENATEKTKLSLEWQIGILRHYIVDPDEKVPAGTRGIEWARKCGERPGLCWQTSTAFVKLMGVDVEDAQKKR